MKKAAIIGTGNMGGALARAICRGIGPDQVLLANRTKGKAQTLAEELGCQTADSGEGAVQEAKYIFLGVKPQGMRTLLEGLAPVLARCHAAGEDKVLVSMAAGLRLGDLRPHLEEAGYDVPLVRVMPNTCVAIGCGMTAVCTPNYPADRELFEELAGLLEETGRAAWIGENLMDQFTAVAGCGPAFVYPYIEALADGGVMAGLPREKAVEYAAQTVLGAAAMVLESGKHPGALKDEVCSPGGSTIAGVAELERGGLRAAAINAVLAACKRSAELGK